MVLKTDFFLLAKDSSLSSSSVLFFFKMYHKMLYPSNTNLLMLKVVFPSSYKILCIGPLNFYLIL